MDERSNGIKWTNNSKIRQLFFLENWKKLHKFFNFPI